MNVVELDDGHWTKRNGQTHGVCCLCMHACGHADMRFCRKRMSWNGMERDDIPSHPSHACIHMTHTLHTALTNPMNCHSLNNNNNSTKHKQHQRRRIERAKRWCIATQSNGKRTGDEKTATAMDCCGRTTPTETRDMTPRNDFVSQTNAWLFVVGALGFTYLT